MAEYNEILKLAEMMKAAKIPYSMITNERGFWMKYPEEENFVCSIIENDFSDGHNNDRLEIMGLLTEDEKKEDPAYIRGRQAYNEKHCVRGWLTADDVFGRISTDWNNRTKTYYESQRRIPGNP